MKGVLNTLVSEANTYIPITIAMTAAYHRRTYQYRRQAESTDEISRTPMFLFFLAGLGFSQPFCFAVCCFFLSDVLFTDGIKAEAREGIQTITLEISINI